MKAIIKKDTNEEYHSNKDFIGSTSLKKYKKSPLHFKEETIKETPAMQFGTMYHTFILEPEIFEKEYYVFDDSQICEELKSGAFFDEKGKQIFAKSPRANKIYKEWHDQQMTIAGQRITVSKEEYDQIQAMKRRLFSHFYAKYLLTGGVSELSYYTEIEGVKVKIRPDHMIEKKRICVDLKTCIDASYDKFIKHSADMLYHINAALYSDVLEKEHSPGLPWTFIFIAQEKAFPFAFNIFKASSQFISIGQYEYELLLKQHKYSLDSNEYRGYDVFCDNKYGITEISVPAYAIKDYKFYNIYDDGKE